MSASGPSGPLRHNSIETPSPTTTGGSPIPVLTRLERNARPRNGRSASSTPSGTPTSAASAVASPETASESAAMRRMAGSRSTRRRNAPANPCQIRSTQSPVSSSPQLLSAQGTNSGCPYFSRPKPLISFCASGDTRKSPNASAPSAFTLGNFFGLIPIT